MGLDFSRSQANNQTIDGGNVISNNIVEPVDTYDIVADREQMNQLFVNSDEVDALASQIEVYNLETIVGFGAEAANEVSKASDTVLNSMDMSQLDGSSEMLKVLANIMDKFDIDEIKENSSLFDKVFNNTKKQLEKILA